MKKYVLYVIFFAITNIIYCEESFEKLFNGQWKVIKTDKDVIKGDLVWIINNEGEIKFKSNGKPIEYFLQKYKIYKNTNPQKVDITTDVNNNISIKSIVKIEYDTMTIMWFKSPGSEYPTTFDLTPDVFSMILKQFEAKEESKKRLLKRYKEVQTEAKELKNKIDEINNRESNIASPMKETLEEIVNKYIPLAMEMQTIEKEFKDLGLPTEELQK